MSISLANVFFFFYSNTIMIRKNSIVATAIFIFGIFLFIFHKTSSAALRCITRRDTSGRIYQDCHEIVPTPKSTPILIPTPISTHCGAVVKCLSGYECYQPPMPTCPTGRICTQIMPPRYCKVVPTNTPVPSKPTITLLPGCSFNNQCPPGYMCYQPPIVTKCPDGPCAYLPAKYCKPTTCEFRGKGDANCDQQVNEADLLELRKKLNNQPLSIGAVTDFNLDGKTDMIDYEIWRSNK